jgi:hypothetical protein
VPRLEAFPMATRPPQIVPGRPQRRWMDTFVDRHPYRCLPLTMANTSGWELLCPISFAATWDGGPHNESISFKLDRPFPEFDDLARSHFSHGVLTFHAGYLFRTPENWSMWVMGPPNHIKDGIQPLTGLVETDWLPFPFTMNWRFTRPGTIRFEKGEPFCFITLVEDKALETFDLVQRSLASEPELGGQYDAWRNRRDEFNQKLYKRDPETLKEAWQRFYFKGEMPDETGPAPKTHVNKRRLKSLRLGF